MFMNYNNNVNMILLLTLTLSFSVFSLPYRSIHHKIGFLTRNTGHNVIPSWIPNDFAEIKEDNAKNMAEKIKIVPVNCENLSKEPINTSFAFFPSHSPPNPTTPISTNSRISMIQQVNIFLSSFLSKPTSNKDNNVKDSEAPIVLIHGFDSSCFEFRRIAPLLATTRDVYAIDLLGWGFNDHSNVKDFSPESKISHLVSFIRQNIGKPCILVGASLGGAVAIILAADEPELVEKVVLLDAQGFIDGKGKSNIPNFLARFGINVLKSTPLRMFANYIAYKDKKLATMDAMKIGRLHCLTDSWETSSIDFLKSGGFVMSSKVSQIEQPTLVLWGDSDEILEPSTATRFQETLPNGKLEYIESCGHVPHLEQPSITAEKILAFLD